ncbi:MAG: hypothetical protein DSY90_09460 [Deltaproteobacteria bacterium]|nr:MAG: hypothetical protein DSY90_09460 [Deltaproteobacteria bacterium]
MSSKTKKLKVRTFKRDIYAWLGLLLLLLAGYFLYTYGHREPYRFESVKGADLSQDPLLLALSFGQISDHDSGNSLSIEKFRKYLSFLKMEGFTAISLKDARDFYYHGMAIPQKSLLLFFERGYITTYKEVDPVLRQMKWPAVVVIDPHQIDQRNTHYLYWDRLEKMQVSGQWEIAAAGNIVDERALIETKGLDGDASDHERALKIGGQAAQAVARRIRDHYRASLEIIEDKLDDDHPLAFVVDQKMEDSWPLNEDQRKVYLSALKHSYQLCFFADNFGLNTMENKPLGLKRLRIDSGASYLQFCALVKGIVNAPTVTKEPAFKDMYWVLESDSATQTSDRLVLQGEPRAAAWLPPGRRIDGWEIEAKVSLIKGQFWFVQESDADPGSFWRFGGDASGLHLQLGKKGHPVHNLASFAVVASASGSHLKIVKRGEGIWIEWNRRPLLKSPLYLPGKWQGKSGWIGWSPEGKAHVVLYQARMRYLAPEIYKIANWPDEEEVQRLISIAPQISGITFQRGLIDGKALCLNSYDRILFKMLCHRFGWKLIPTITVAAPEGNKRVDLDDLRLPIQMLTEKMLHLDFSLINLVGISRSKLDNFRRGFQKKLAISVASKPAWHIIDASTSIAPLSTSKRSPSKVASG